MSNHTLSNKQNALGLVSLLSAAVLYVSTSTVSAGEIEDYVSRYQPTIEPLHGLEVTERSATIVVTSNGCTKKQDFIVVLDKSQPSTATFIRLIPDFCKAVSHPYPIKFSLQEVGATTFAVSNLFEPPPR